MALTKVKAGNILLTTPGASSNDVTPATTAYVTTALANLADSAPSTLNTLNELAAALGDDANFSTTVTNSIAAKLPLAGGTMTGNLAITTASTADTVTLTRGTTSHNNMLKFKTGSSDKWIVGQRNDSTDHFRFYSYGTSSDVLSISTDGSVLVGKTAEGTATDGIELNRQDVIVATRNGDSPLILNRRTSDGDIALFRKDNSTVGSIGANGGYIYVGSGDTNLRFHAGADAILPANAGGASRSAAIDLGSSGAKFKDLYLSGTIETAQIDISINTNARMYSSAALSEVGTGTFALQVVNAAGSALKPLGFRAEDIRFATGSSERMRLDSTGRLIVGGTASSGSSGGVTVSSASSGYRHMYIWNSGMYFWNGANEANLSSGGAWNDASDERLKENITDIPYGLAEVKQLQPKKYSMITGGEEQVGLIAQEVETIIPELVTTSGEANMKSLSYGHLNAVLIKAIQEQQTLIESLTARITTLEG